MLLSGNVVYFPWHKSWPKSGLPGPLKFAVVSVCVRYLIPEHVIPHMSWMRLRTAPEAAVLLHSLLKPVKIDRTSAHEAS